MTVRTFRNPFDKTRCNPIFARSKDPQNYRLILTSSVLGPVGSKSYHGTPALSFPLQFIRGTLPINWRLFNLGVRMQQFRSRV